MDLIDDEIRQSMWSACRAHILKQAHSSILSRGLWGFKKTMHVGHIVFLCVCSIQWLVGKMSNKDIERDQYYY